MTDAQDRSRSPVPKDPQEVVVSGLGGETWKISLGVTESVAELRQKIASASSIPLEEIVLTCGAERLLDEHVPLQNGSVGGQIRLVRIKTIVPELEKLKEAIADFKQDANKHELKGEKWIKNHYHSWELFQGKPMPEDNDWEEKEIMFSTGDPDFTLTRYNLSDNPDIHIILAKAYTDFQKKWELSNENPELAQIEDFTATFADLENATEEIIKEFYPPDTGKQGCKSYDLVESGNFALSVAISPGWVYVYESDWG